ncbi:excinuclease ABC subunit A [Alteromonadaceae bacterium BrNp21-10]|nr:excinuclease ABC subunit A [Alteromonadaceae bacterium BrNp21-10]
MKKSVLVVVTTCLLLTTNAIARDDRVKFEFEQLLQSEKAKQALLDIPVFFAGQNHPAPLKTWGEVSTSRKTNAFGKSDQEACEWVLLSALKVLQERARKEGMNAVINIKSNYKHQEFVSSTEFECGAGTLMAGVALTGDIVKLPE